VQDKEGVEEGSAVMLGLSVVAVSDPEALGGGTESPPIGAALLAAFGEAGVLAKVAGLEPALAVGALRAGFPPLPQAASKTLAATTAPAVARPAGTRLPRRRSAVSCISLRTDFIDPPHLTQKPAGIDFRFLPSGDQNGGP
jgi:hypothetical protein